MFTIHQYFGFFRLENSDSSISLTHTRFPGPRYSLKYLVFSNLSMYFIAKYVGLYVNWTSFSQFLNWNPFSLEYRLKSSLRPLNPPILVSISFVLFIFSFFYLLSSVFKLFLLIYWNSVSLQPFVSSACLAHWT